MIDPEGLAAFVAIADTGSFSRAADMLDVAQSVVSKRLKRLEDQLDAQLVDRSVRNAIRLSPVGQIYLPEARATLAQLDKAARVGRNLARGAAGPLRIGTIFSATLDGSLGRILAAVHADLPDMAVDVRMMETPEQLAALEAGRLDVALVRPRPSYPALCHARVVQREPLMIALADAHRLAGAGPLTPAMLAGERFIIPQFHEQVGLMDNLARLAQAGGFVPGAIIRTGDFVSAACLAAVGKGVVLAPASLRHLGIGALAFCAIAGFDDRIDTMMVWRRDAPRQAMACIAGAANPT
ncbi:MAG: hypothetical protein RIS94_1254 [Pseudomonadota bacterium]